MVLLKLLGNSVVQTMQGRCSSLRLQAQKTSLASSGALPMLSECLQTGAAEQLPWDEHGNKMHSLPEMDSQNACLVMQHIYNMRVIYLV